MAHDICVDMWCACKQDLAPDWVTLRVFDTRKVSSGVACAIEDDSGLLAKKSVVEMFNLATEESYT